jgi:hypothetical protein
VLQDHIFPKVFAAADFRDGMKIKNMNGGLVNVTVTGTVVSFTTENGTKATVSKPDIVACKSVIHSIDTVLANSVAPPNVTTNATANATAPLAAPLAAAPMASVPLAADSPSASVAPLGGAGPSTPTLSGARAPTSAGARGTTPSAPGLPPAAPKGSGALSVGGAAIGVGLFALVVLA